MDASAPAPAPAWDLVVKVKYGDTLRRFNVSVHGRDFDHDMNKLRTKIINFFKFNANANMILTYTDEDGDAVTLVDDDELRDAVFRQHLNPLRINVQLNTDFAARAEARPHLEASNIAPKTGTQGIQASHLSSIDDALQSVPDPLRGVLSKISHDFMSKAAASAPALAEFVEYFSKLGQTPTSTESNTLNNADFGRASASEPNAVDLNMGDRPKPLHDPKSSKKPATTNTTEGMSMSAPDSLVDVNLEIPDLSFLKESVSSALAKGKSESKKVASGLPDGKSIATTPVPAVDKPVHHQSQNNVISVPPPVAYPPGITDFLYGDGKGIPCSTSPSVPQFGFNHQNSLPINKHTGAPAPNQIPTSGLSQVFSPYRKARESRGLYDSMLRTFHRGVRCDGCGMHPIMGPRFKSNVKDDYDLCSICFSEMGNEADYTRIDRAPYKPPRFLKEFNNPLQHSRFHGPHGCRGYGLRSCKGKLESRFIQDVTVLDGTLRRSPSIPLFPVAPMPLPPKAAPEAGMKRGDNKPRVPPALSVPISEVSFGKFLTHCGTFKDGDLLVNKDGLRIVRQNGEPAQPLIKPSDNQLALDDMDMIQVIGKGTSGIVQLVRHKWTEQFFALKAIQLSNILEETRKQIAQELKINYSINHSSQCPYIVAYYQSFYDNGVITIVLEYMDGGSLADFLKKVKSIPEPYLAAICKQVLKGLIYLHHEKRIVHRDLKPANLLINHRGEVKITDFGVSATLESSSGQRETFVGTCSYMSPERIMGGRHGPLSDIWSLGLVLLECATGQFPYAHPDGQEAYNSVFELLEAIVLRPPPCAPSDMFSEEFCSFISACIQQEPKDRKSALELMEHPFLTMYEGENVDLASYFTKAGPPLATF